MGFLEIITHKYPQKTAYTGISHGATLAGVRQPKAAGDGGTGPTRFSKEPQGHGDQCEPQSAFGNPKQARHFFWLAGENM